MGDGGDGSTDIPAVDKGCDPDNSDRHTVHCTHMRGGVVGNSSGGSSDSNYILH